MKAQEKVGKIRISPVTRNGKSYQRFIFDLGMVDGKRVRRSFSTYEEALAEQKKQTSLHKKIGRAAKRLTDDQLSDAVRALALLPKGATLTEAAEAYPALSQEQRNDAVDALAELDGNETLTKTAKFWIKHNKPKDGRPVTCKELLDMYIENAKKVGRRPATLHELRSGTSSFINTFGGEPVTHVTKTDLEKWHNQQNGGPVTLNKHRRLIIALFNFAIKKEMLETNPASALDVIQEERGLPYVMPVKDVRKMLNWAAKNTPDMIPYYALALFAGIRPGGELKRLDWSNIDFEEKEIYIKPSVSKTHDERYVKMSDNLTAWLEPYAKESGPIFYSRRQFRKNADRNKNQLRG